MYLETAMGECERSFFPECIFPQEQGGFTRVGFCHYHTLQEVKAELLKVTVV